MKKAFIALLAALALIPVLAFCEGPVLLVEIPEGAQMVENVAFDDGDFIQTYQTPGGATVQLLRYGALAMTAQELTDSDWPDHCHAEALELTEISGCPAQGVHIWQALEGGYPVAVDDWQNPPDGTQMMECILVLVQQGEGTLIFQGSYMTQDAGREVQAMLDSLKVLSEEGDVG